MNQDREIVQENEMKWSQEGMMKNKQEVANNHQPRKKKTKGKKTTVENITESMIKMFVEFQERSKERFMKFEVLRAKEDRAHEERLLRLLVALQQPSHVPQYPTMYDSTITLKMIHSVVTINQHALFLWKYRKKM